MSKMIKLTKIFSVFLLLVVFAITLTLVACDTSQKSTFTDNLCENINCPTNSHCTKGTCYCDKNFTLCNNMCISENSCCIDSDCSSNKKCENNIVALAENKRHSHLLI